ncbi:MAG: EamA family transporter [Alphaproteobacteria bacterium]
MSIYLFFPIFAAMFYGLAFAFTEKALKLTNVSTYLAISIVSGALIMLAFIKLKGEPLNFDFVKNKSTLAIVLTSVIAPSLGWIFTTFAIKTTSASYAAFAEISYPLFTVLFLFTFFGLRAIDWTTIAGGLLIMTGSFLMIWGKTKS